MPEHFVYILHCVNDTFYTGYTNDIERRYQEHLNQTNKCRYTRSFPPKKIAAYWCFADKSSALKEEARIKKLSRREKEALIATQRLVIARSVFCDEAIQPTE